jgi:hypothetical protein
MDLTDRKHLAEVLIRSCLRRHGHINGNYERMWLDRIGAHNGFHYYQLLIRGAWSMVQTPSVPAPQSEPTPEPQPDPAQEQRVEAAREAIANEVAAGIPAPPQPLTHEEVMEIMGMVDAPAPPQPITAEELMGSSTP